MMEKIERPPLPTDQETVQKGVYLLSNFINAHPEIEPTLWYSVLFGRIVEGCGSCGMTREQFKEWIYCSVQHYEGWFDE